MRKLTTMLEDELLTSRSDPVPRGPKKQFPTSFFRVALRGSWMILISSAMMAATASYAQMPANDLTLEIMMNAEAQDQMLVDLVAPWQANDAVGYNFNCDYNAQTFDYSTQPGQSVDGQAFSLSDSGSFNASLGAWSWTSSGLIGSDAFSITGTATGDVIGITGLYLDEGPVEYSAVGMVTILKDGSSKGTFVAQLGAPAGPNAIPVASGNCTDDRVYDDVNKKWVWVFTWVKNQPPPVEESELEESGGTANDNGIGQLAGSFVQTVETVPEPCTLALLGVGTLSLLAYEWRRRQAKA